MLDHAKLCRIHRGITGQDSEEAHEQLYRAYPTLRGYASSALNLPYLQATIVLGLSQTYMLHPERMTKTAFLVSPTAEKWALEQLDLILREIFDQCRQTGNLRVAQYLGAALKHFLIGNRILQIEEPTRWVAFGFDLDMPLPDWMKDSLLTGV